MSVEMFKSYKPHEPGTPFDSDIAINTRIRKIYGYPVTFEAPSVSRLQQPLTPLSLEVPSESVPSRIPAPVLSPAYNQQQPSPARQ